MHSDQKHCYCVSLSLKDNTTNVKNMQVIAKSKANALGNNKHTTQKQNKQDTCPVTGVQLMCQIFMNDLFTEKGQQRSRVIG